MSNSIFIAASIDGYIADSGNGLSFLDSVPNNENDDLGYNDFIDTIDCIVMGRNTYDVVIGFGIEWPYTVPVFVLSNNLKSVSEQLQDKVEILHGDVEEVVNSLHKMGYERLYVDGKDVIRQFLERDMIDDMTITTIPILLGEGIPLFTPMRESKMFSLVNTKVYINDLVASHFHRERDRDLDKKNNTE